MLTYYGFYGQTAVPSAVVWKLCRSYRLRINIIYANDFKSLFIWYAIVWFENIETQFSQEPDLLLGRETPIETARFHYVNGRSLHPPYPQGLQEVLLGMGCFWGAERCFWSLPGVFVTAVGYAGGETKNPLYEEICTGRTGHNEVVRVVYDPAIVTLEGLLVRFWESHDPTQGMRQGNDVGSQYRSGIYLPHAQIAVATETRNVYQQRLAAHGYAEISTEILPMPYFYYAEDYHQQYLAKNPNGYCGLGGTGVRYA